MNSKKYIDFLKIYDFFLQICQKFSYKSIQTPSLSISLKGREWVQVPKYIKILSGCRVGNGNERGPGIGPVA